MLLLAHEFQVLKQIHEAGTLSVEALQPMTARILYGHRLARKLGNQVAATLLGEEVLKRGVVKSGKVADYVQLSEAVALV